MPASTPSKAGPRSVSREKDHDSGALSATTIIGLVRRHRPGRLREGFLFDGFPRTIPPAEAMKLAGVKARLRVEIDVPSTRSSAHERPAVAPGRADLPRQVQPPKVADRDDVHRSEPSAARRRTRCAAPAGYSDQTPPLVDYSRLGEGRPGQRAAVPRLADRPVERSTSARSRPRNDKPRAAGSSSFKRAKSKQCVVLLRDDPAFQRLARMHLLAFRLRLEQLGINFGCTCRCRLQRSQCLGPGCDECVIVSALAPRG